VRRREGLASIGLLSLVLLLFSDAVFRGRVFYERDLALDWYTQMDAFARSVAAGSWPLWDNTIAFGHPLLADPGAQILYPLTWLNLVMRPWSYYTIFAVFHAGLAGIGLQRLGRRLGLSHLGSFVAATVWIASGPFVSMVNLWHHFAGAAWTPWVLLAAHDATGGPRLRPALRWAIVAACQVLAGSADVCAMTWLLSVGLVAQRIEWRSWRRRWNFGLLSRMILVASLAGALSAAVWVPALDIARRSSRWHYAAEVRTAWSLDPTSMAALFLPVSDDGWRSVLPEVPPPLPELWRSLYLGLSTVGFVAMALASRGLRGRMAYAACFVVAFLAAMGRNTPVYGIAVFLLPFLRIFRYPSKAVIVVALAWALLAGLGFGAWAEAPRRRGRAGSLAMLVALLASAAAVVLGAGPSGWTGMPGADRMHLVSAGLCAAAMALLLRFGKSPAAIAAVVLLPVADLALVHRGLNRTAAPSLVSFRPPFVDAVASDDGSRLYVYDYQTPGSSRRYLGRDDPYVIHTPPPGVSLEATQVLSQRLYPFPPVGGRWGLEGSYDLDFRGLYPIQLDQLVDSLRRVEGTPAHTRLLQLGAVRSVVSLHLAGLEDLRLAHTIPTLFPEPLRVLTVPKPLPRAYVVSGTRRADGGEAVSILTDPAFDPEREIVLAEAEARPPVNSFRGSARIRSLLPDRVEIESDSTAPAYLVLVDSYDPGWHATVDGAATRLLRANLAFRAVEIPPGHHVVEMVYRPPAVVWGLIMSSLAVAGVVATLVLRPR